MHCTSTYNVNKLHAVNQLRCATHLTWDTERLLDDLIPSLVLSTLSLATLTSTRLMMYVQLPSVNPANVALLLRRFAKTFP